MPASPVKRPDGSLDWSGVPTIASGQNGGIFGPADNIPLPSAGRIGPAPLPGAPADPNQYTTPAPLPEAVQPKTDPTKLLQDLKASFPWLDQVGFDPAFFQSLVAGAASPDEVIVNLRNTPQYKQRFPGLWRKDGSLRMNEAQYLQTETSYRQVLSQFGYGDQYKDAVDLVGFFESEQDPNELNQRLTTFKQIKDSSQPVKDAFYVYSGMSLTDEDLYMATVDPAAKQNLADEWHSRVASGAFDYTTFITRATELGLTRVSETLQQAQKAGAVTGTAVQRVLQVDPNFARQIMDVLYGDGGGASPGQTMNLQELLATFEQAAIGGAAIGAGLTMPTKERAAQFRAAGIDAAKARSVYGQLGPNQNIYAAAVERTGGGEFDQTQAENALFLGDATATQRLQTGLAREDAAGNAVGQFQISQTPTGFAQKGLRIRP